MNFGDNTTTTLRLRTRPNLCLKNALVHQIILLENHLQIPLSIILSTNEPRTRANYAWTRYAHINVSHGYLS